MNKRITLISHLLLFNVMGNIVIPNVTVIKIMSSVFNRLVELAGWVVVGLSVCLLMIAHHIDNYQSPEPTAQVQKSEVHG